ncbi:hypothetical protein GCM10023172_15270 [Hymenobacter ginsengisoli]|uniref:DNA alkylation repair protein n=1 Tax=Hymenobacter ginsengisoli TaxID=1051626 RepID=A0ABP8Q7E4_9BACT|nr:MULTISPECIES: hypothetical protein [unclassified Hymenobacter]MBO2030923.1 hypothetical protein [Hymenobacter sp. BT559]
MQTIDTILSTYNLNESEIRRIANEAKAVSVGCGTQGVVKQLSSETWTLLDEISDEVWYSKMEVADKISLGFQLYEKFPSYYHFLVPFYHGVRDKEISLPDHKKIIWEHFIQYLASEAYYADPVSYVLWVEFFEDATTVRDTWQGLLNNCRDKKCLLSMLEIAGPVPFDLKEPCYKALITDKASHEVIFNSILHSAFDYFGNIDKKKASIILSKLSIDKKAENYKLLKDKLR